MKKIISTKERIFISLVVKVDLEICILFLLIWLKIDTFQPKFYNVFINQLYQPVYGQMQRKNLRFIHGVDFELIENFPNNGTVYLLKFDDSCEKI